MVIRVDKNNFFYDTHLGERVEEYDPLNSNLEFVFNGDGYVVHVSADKIKTMKLGICFDFEGKTHIIDDNHQQVMVYSAYLINDTFDAKIEQDQEKGNETREKISNIIGKTIREDFNSCYLSNQVTNILNYCADFRMSVQAEGKICFQTISNLVNTNKLMREFDLPYYPFLRGIDRYNAYYLTMWVTETGQDVAIKNAEFELLVNEIINKMNQNTTEFHFSAKSLNINTRIIRIRDDLVPSTI